MGLEQKINYQLNKYPAVKKIVKSIYQHVMYAISPKIKSEGDIIRISPDDADHEYFFGYYDKSPWDISDRYVLCVKARNTWTDVSPKEKADIILIDTEKKESDPERVKKIGETRAWNVQQSCMLQWMGPDYRNRILYNDYRNGQYCSVILSLPTMEEKIIPFPVYSVSSDGKFALTLDFSRLYELRPGYGYYNVPEKTKGVSLPETTAIWKVNLETGEAISILKYTDFATFQPRLEMTENGAVHKVNHIMLSPDNKRFIVLYRWFIGERKYTRLITCNVDGSDMYVLSDDDMVSHCFWKDSKYIIAFANKVKGGTGYYLMKDKTEKFYHCWPEMTGDGHPSFSPDRKLIVTDTYPNRSRIASIKIMDGDVRKRDVNVIAKVFAPFKYDNDTRCDLHPRWNHASNKICFDSVFENHRGLYCVNLEKKNEERNKNVIRILQISDSMKQRFGVTSFLMNYNEFIDREQIVFDYLIIDTEEDIGEKIEKFGGNIYYMPKLGLRNIVEYTKKINNFFKTHNYHIVHSHFYQVDFICAPYAYKYGTKHYIAHGHSAKYGDYRIRAIRNCIMSLPVRFIASDFCACSEKAGDFLFGKRILARRNKKLTVIPNAIKYSKFWFNESMRDFIRKKYKIENSLVFGNVGSLKIPKNHSFMLKIFREIVNLHENSILLLVGDGPLREELENQVKDLHIEGKVIFVGTTDEPWSYYNAFDCYLFPSLYEGFGLSLIEAEVNGLPCLCSESIPDEPFISKRAQKISLNEAPALWAETALKEAFEGRDGDDLDSKYDLKIQGKMLTDFYKGLSI